MEDNMSVTEQLQECKDGSMEDANHIYVNNQPNRFGAIGVVVANGLCSILRWMCGLYVAFSVCFTAWSAFCSFHEGDQQMGTDSTCLVDCSAPFYHLLKNKLAVPVHAIFQLVNKLVWSIYGIFEAVQNLPFYQEVRELANALSIALCFFWIVVWSDETYHRRVPLVNGGGSAWSRLKKFIRELKKATLREAKKGAALPRFVRATLMYAAIFAFIFSPLCASSEFGHSETTASIARVGWRLFIANIRSCGLAYFLVLPVALNWDIKETEVCYVCGVSVFLIAFVQPLWNRFFS